MDLPLALARKHAEIVSEGHAGEVGEPDPTEEHATMSEPLFKVSNQHAAACGQPPALDGDTPHCYCGYFANEHGEQALYVYDYATGEATVRMGDTDWHHVHRVAEGRIEGVMLTDAELAWIRACWLATGALKQRG